MRKLFILIHFALTLLMSSTLTSITFGTAPTTIEPPAVVFPSSPVKVKLAITQVSDLTIEITCGVHIGNLGTGIGDCEGEVEILLSDGFFLKEGMMSWKGRVVSNSEVYITAVAKAGKQGIFKITGKATCLLANGDSCGDEDSIHVSVSKEVIDSISENPQIETNSMCKKVLNPPKAEEHADGHDGKSPPAAVTPTGDHVYARQALIEPNSPGELTIIGRFWYWDNNQVLRPLGWATVWIYDAEWWGGSIFLGATLTDLDGRFTFGPINNDDGWLEDGLDIMVCLVALSEAARVVDDGGALYDGWTPTYGGCPDGTLDIGDWTVPPAEMGAWMIFSYDCGLTRGWDYLLNQGPNYNCPQVTCRWPTETNTMPPHYHQGGEIHLPDFNSSRSPDVIIHEYGHHVMWNVYNGHWPPNTGGQHEIRRISNVNLAWVEGWANFFALAVFNDPTFTYVGQFTHNLETPTWGTAGWDDGDAVEGRVTGALWDFFDSTNEGHDAFTNGFLNIWDVVSSQTDDTFAEFWAAWRQRGHNIPHATYAIWHNTMIYFGDLDHITLTPSSATAYIGLTYMFIAQGYDASSIPVVGLIYSWSVTGGIGSVNPTTTVDVWGPGESSNFQATNGGTGSVQATATYGNMRIGSASVTVLSGGGGGCPKLFTWNGKSYVDYGVIDIHNPTGEDVIREVSIRTKDLGVTDQKVSILLQEGWPELAFSESFIDQVKLYAVDANGKLKLCPLTYANHDRLGDVVPQLSLSDDQRVQSFLMEKMCVTFFMPYKRVKSYLLIVEGFNPWKE